MTEALIVDTRAAYIRDRLVTINKTAGDIILENGVLLKEVKENAIYKEWGYDSFDQAVDAMHDQGMLTYHARQARNFIAVADLVANRGLKASDIEGIGMSKLRDIASLPAAVATEQSDLLQRAKDMTVADVQREAKAARDKAYGRESDPWEPIVMRNTTASQAQMFRDTIAEARRIYALPEETSEGTVLVDSILSEWNNSKHLYEAEQTEASA